MARPKRYTDPTDLIRMQEDYELSKMSCRKLCSHWNISNGTLQKYIKRYGWSKSGEKKSTVLYAKERLQYNIELSEKNRKKLIESGGKMVVQSVELPSLHLELFGSFAIVKMHGLNDDNRKTRMHLL